MGDIGEPAALASYGSYGNHGVRLSAIEDTFKSLGWRGQDLRQSRAFNFTRRPPEKK
jgi:hypothetical protein